VAGSIIIIVEYDPHWPDVFDELRAPVVAALGDLAVSVEHVGSTAVPGLAAKPIIDMDAVVPSVVHVPKAIERLALLGYAHRGDLGIPGREAFTSPSGKPAHFAPSAAKSFGVIAHFGTTSGPTLLMPGSLKP
jgi:GrpB-like predicted nucleotidyltransferase (UPF0157 family)